MKDALTEDTIRLVRSRVAEWGCLGEILHCANTDCLTPLRGLLVGPGGRFMMCNECGSMTCVACRKPGHIGVCLSSILGPLT